MSAIDRLVELGANKEYPFGKDTHVLADENQIRALVAEQVALAVAEYKKDAERYNKLIKLCGFGLRRNGVVELNIVLPSVDHISRLSAGLDEIDERGLIA